MSGFKDPAAAVRCVERIGAATYRDVGEFLLASAEGTARPDQAVVNFERWIAASGSPTTMADAVLGSPETGRLLVTIFGASHQLADVLVQNPELAHLVLDPSSLAERPSAAALKSEISKALSGSTSYTHSLDRLRFVKQGWHLRIAAADLGRLWPEEAVWRAISDVAEALIGVALDVVWKDTMQGEADRPCPVSVVGMGKLGGQELNFSSDVDLVFILDDEAADEVEKASSRACERLSRALSDRMGRGSLYRVDLRLRPYGGRGPVAPRMRAIEGYYDRYAEPWEHLALVRSRVIVGSADVAQRWNEMRDRTCFQPQRGEWFVTELLSVRERIEGRHSESDLKRGPGGIRDIEFLTQILQLLHGYREPKLKVASTLDALDALAESGKMDRAAVEDLSSAYVFLRQVEHRIQLLGDQQSHTVTEDLDARAELAARVGFATVDSFDSALATHRAHARTWYKFSFEKASDVRSPRDEVLARVAMCGAILAHWIDGLPSSESFYSSLLENESSLHRFIAVCSRAPALVPQLRQHVSVTEELMSGEIAEDFDHATGIDPEDVERTAQKIRRAWLRLAVNCALSTEYPFSTNVSKLYDDVVTRLTEDTGIRPIALGSYAAREMSLFSDLDVLFWRDGPLDHEADERAAQRVLATVQALRRAGAPIELDLRLRPEGKKGRLVHNERSLRQYEADSMQPWERLALGRARAAGGLPRALTKAAYGHPLDADTLHALRAIKKRVETERVPIQYRRRHIKLGPGGQDDLIWLMQLLWWKHHHHVGIETASISERLPELLKIGVLNAVERDQIASAWRFFSDLRINLGLFGFNDEVLPENPDKLAKLGAVLGPYGQNEVLAEYERQTAVSRGLFESTLERLGG